MGKHVKSYAQVVNESIGRGSIVLIKGKADGEKKKLYATHITGSAALPNKGMMLFLSDDFYRIKEEDGRLKAVKIGYRSEDDLKSALNLKSPGKISIARNNNKTPLHWKTLKHTSIQSALKEIESDLTQDAYLLESVAQQDEDIRLWNEFTDLVLARTVNTVFLGKEEIDVISYRIDDIYSDILDSEESQVVIEWQLDLKVLLRDRVFKPYLEHFEISKKSIEVSFFFTSDISLYIQYDRGDYWTPPSTDVDINSAETHLDEVMVEGSDLSSEKSQELISQVRSLVAKKEMLPDELEKFILPNLSSQLLMRKEK